MRKWALSEAELRGARMRVRRWTARASEALAVGVIAVAPLALTLWVLWFVVRAAALLGALITAPLSGFVLAVAPGLEGVVRQPLAATVVNVVVALVALTVVGVMAKGVVGQLVGEIVERLVTRIPIGNTVYGSARQLIASFQPQPDKAQNVVLIEFPSPEMRCVGLVTKRFRASDTGEELAAVYVPTTPNPTSGYVEIVPAERLVWLDWSVNEAIQFIVSGGVIAPDTVVYRRTGRVPAAGAPPPEPPAED